MRWSGDEWGVRSGVIGGAVMSWGTTAILSLHSEKNNIFELKDNYPKLLLLVYTKIAPGIIKKRPFFHHRNNAENALKDSSDPTKTIKKERKIVKTSPA